MTAPFVDPYADTNALANRIAQHIKAHPEDRQAREDLRYIVSVMRQRPKDTTALDNPPEPSVGNQVASGLASVPGDIVKSALTAIMHPIRTAGQVTGVANLPNYVRTARDPNASNAEKLEAVVRATPLNAGYAPARAFLESTGMKSDQAAPLSEQVRQGGDLAATLLLARYGGPVAKKVTGLPGRIVGRILGKDVASPVPAPATEPTMPPAEAAIRANLVKQGFSPENIEQLVRTYRNGGRLTPTNTPPLTATPRLPRITPSEPMDQPAFLRRAGQPAVPGRPDLGTLVEGSPTQTAGSPLRTQSPPMGNGAAAASQMQMIVDALKGVPRAEWPAKLAPFQALGMLSDTDISQLLAMP